jgi:hypothetical protein
MLASFSPKNTTTSLLFKLHYKALILNILLLLFFSRDFTSICKQAIKKYIIVNAFATSKMWLLSAKARIKKMQLYKKRSIDKVKQGDTLKLSPLLLT